MYHLFLLAVKSGCDWLRSFLCLRIILMNILRMWVNKTSVWYKGLKLPWCLLFYRSIQHYMKAFFPFALNFLRVFVLLSGEQLVVTGWGNRIYCAVPSRWVGTLRLTLSIFLSRDFVSLAGPWCSHWAGFVFSSGRHCWELCALEWEKDMKWGHFVMLWAMGLLIQRKSLKSINC